MSTPSALGPQRSRIADDPAPVARWRVDFTTPDVRPRALATLPEGLALTRASAATFATSATATDSAAANEACLSRSTDYVASQGLLVRPSSGGRAADRLYVAAAAVLDGGRLALEVTLLPAYSPTGYGYNPRLWTTDAGDYAEIDHSTGRLVVSIDGASWSPTAALSWTAGQTVTIRVEAGGGTEYSGASYRVGSGAPVDLGTSTSVQAALAPTTIDLLCNGTSQCFEGTVRTLSAWTQAQSASAPVTFDPSDLSPVWWYDADDATGSDGGPIAGTWPGRGGTPNGDFGIAENPTLHLGTGPNGHDEVEFAAAAFTGGVAGAEAPTVCTIYLVWNDADATSNQVLFSADDAAGWIGLTYSAPTLSFGAHGTNSATVAVAATGVLWGGVVWDGASSRVRARTGGATVEATMGGGTLGALPSGSGNFIGCDTTTGNGLTGRLLLAIAFDHALDATERASLEAWLNDRYGL